jgi:putative transposase
MMLKKAFKKIPNNTNLTLHSEVGNIKWKISAFTERKELYKVCQENCLDNAIIENFFGILKSELFYLKKYTSLDQLKRK